MKSTKDDIPSPCIGVCTLDPLSGYCRGCWRSVAEIAGWPRASADQKRALLALLVERRAANP